MQQAALLVVFAVYAAQAVVLPPDASAVSQWLTFLTPIALAVLAVTQIISSKLSAERALAVKASLVTVEKTTKDIHMLTNSAMGAELTKGVEDAEQMVIVLKVLADIRKTPGDDEAVAAAEKKVAQRKDLLQAHLISQAKVDASAAAPTHPGS